MDNRYSISKEFTGAPKLQHVLRFCGKYISSHNSRLKANKAKTEYIKEREIKLIGVQ